MKSCSSCFIIFLFVISLGGALFLFTARNTIYNPEFHKKNLRKTNFYQETITKAPDLIVDAIAKSNDAIDPQQVAVVKSVMQNVKTSISADWLQTQSETIIDGVFRYAYTGETPKIVIALDSIKIPFTSGLVQNFTEMAKQLPACKPNETPSETNPCLPANFDTKGIAKTLGSNESNPFQAMSTQFDLGSLITKNSGLFKTLRFNIRWSGIFFWVSIILLIITTAIAILTNRKNTGAGLKLIGIPTVVVGGLGLLLDGVSLLSNMGISNFLASKLHSNYLWVMADLISVDFRAYITYVIIAHIIVLGIGIALVIAGIILTKKAPAPTPTNTPPATPPPPPPKTNPPATTPPPTPSAKN